MKSTFKIAASVLLSSFMTTNAYAENIENQFKGDWKGYFRIIDGNYVRHWPGFVSLNDAFISTTGLHFGANSTIYGMKISPCGLHIVADSTREEFIEALHCSGLY